MVKRVGYSGGFITRSEALREASRRRRMKKYKDDKITVPKRRSGGYYRIRYEYGVSDSILTEADKRRILEAIKRKAEKKREPTAEQIARRQDRAGIKRIRSGRF